MSQIKLYQLLLVGGLLAAACKKDNKPADIQGGNPSPLTVKVNESARLTQNVTINVDAIADSRCPATAICIWQGNAKVKFTLKDELSSQSGELCIGQCDQQAKNQDSVTLQLGSKTYEITLTEVRPYPGTDENASTEAIIQVRQK
jgi:hypothetical protein